MYEFISDRSVLSYILKFEIFQCCPSIANFLSSDPDIKSDSFPLFSLFNHNRKLGEGQIIMHNIHDF